VRQVGQVRQVGELFGYRSLILRSLFAHCSLIVCRWEGREGWEGWGE